MTKKQLFIILFQIGFGITFSIGGTLALSEIFLVLFFITRLNTVLKYFKIPEVVVITKLYIGLFLAQLVAELLVGNVISNSIKILALTFMSYLQFIFFLIYFFKDRKYILYALAGIALRYLIFGSSFETDSTIESVANGEAAVFVKFVLIHIIFNPILILTVFIKNKKKLIYIVIGTGVLFVLIGARSGGAFFVLTGALAYFILRGKRVNKLVIIRSLLVTSLIGYGFFSFYINNVLSGEIVSGNSWQIKKLDNPYNPANLLIMGRTEVFVGLIAFQEKLWTGHGAWTRDVTGKYHMMINAFRGDELKYKTEDVPLIPAHSVIIGAGVRNGIFAFIFMLLLWVKFLKIGFNSLVKNDPYLVIIIYFIIQLLWNGMFSPIGHLRQTFPLYFAFLLVSFLLQKKEKRQNFKEQA